MRNRLLSVLAMALLVSAVVWLSEAVGQAPPAPKAQPAPSAQPAAQARPELPGAFQTLSATGPRPGDYICPVCDANLNPGVLVFFREIEDPDRPIPSLLKKLDPLVAKYPDAHLSIYGILLDDGGYRDALLAKADANGMGLDAALSRRDALAAKLRDLADPKGLGLQNVIFTLGMVPDSLQAYQINPSAYATVLLFTKHQRVAVSTFQPDQLTDQAAAQILQEVDKMATEAQKRTVPKGK